MMKKILILLLISSFQGAFAQTNEVTASATAFLNLLTPDIKDKAQYKYDDEERFDWHFVPKGRNGISIHELSQPQFDAAINLLKASLSVQGFKKATDVLSLESVLREVEGRGV